MSSVDNAFMSMGYMQWPVLFYKPIGKLQRLAAKAPNAFKKYGIELDKTRHYNFTIGGYKDKSIAFKGINNPNELHSLKWAKRFLCAGLDLDIVVAETKLALVVVDESRKKIERYLKRAKTAKGKDLDRVFSYYYNRSVMLKALVQETFNHRPAYLYKIMLKVTKQAKGKSLTDQAFLDLTRKETKKYYAAKGKAKSGENMVNKTGKL